jgi:phosphoglycolate phosphatase-like HAD superfamily hydrolase
MHFNFDTSFMEAFEELNKLDESVTSIRCMYALYEDDDGYVCKTGVYAGDLDEEEMEELLSDRGMCYIQCWDEYEAQVDRVPNVGDVVDVFDVEDEDIEDVAAIAGKDPQEYREAYTKDLSEAAEEDPYGYGPYKTPDDPTLRVGDYIKAKQYPRDEKWYPGRVTQVTPDFVSYKISGWGFEKNGTALRSTKAKRAFGNLRKRLSEASNYQASKRFWAEARVGRMDEDSFHAAFDDELKSLGLMDMFDADGVLVDDHPRISNAIDNNPDSWAVKALGKLWGLRYSKKGPNQLFKSERRQIAAKQKAAAEEEKRIAAEKLKKYQSLLLDYIRKADAVAVDEYEEITGIPALDGASLEPERQAINQKTQDYERWYLLSFEGSNIGDYVSEEMLQDEALMLKTIKTRLEKTTAYAKTKAAEEELNNIDIIARRVPGAVVTILGESGTVYEVSISSQRVLYMSIDGEESHSVQMIDEPYEVICANVYESSNNHSTRRDSDSTTYYSWNSRYASILGNKIPKKFYHNDGYMGSYTETVKIDKPVGDKYSKAEGINSWARYTNFTVATD